MDQLPKELHGIFGFRGEPVPDVFQDEIEYVTPMRTPDGEPFRKSLLIHYASDDVPVAFIIGDTVELDGVEMTISGYSSDVIPLNGPESFSYTYHYVVVVKADDGG